jgi:GT2 family glycosyltransferase
MLAPCVIVPNWNGEDSLKACLDSLLAQSLKARVIVVDNGSADGSLRLLEKYSGIDVIMHDRNLGFAGGVNAGFRRAIDDGAKYVAAFNNDAVADKDWLKTLVEYMDRHVRFGMAAPKILTADGKKIDSTGDFLTVWGLPYPRGRGESDVDAYDDRPAEVFAASGGASLYRVKMLREVGLFDEDFFAYYEDVDLSFRAQLAGWEAAYVPGAVVRHAIGATSGRMRGFTTYQTLKNLPMLTFKNVPRAYLWTVYKRLLLADTMFFFRALTRGHVWAAVKGELMFLRLLPGTLVKRRRVQALKTVTDEYVWVMMTHDLPPNARALKGLRRAWWRLKRVPE